MEYLKATEADKFDILRVEPIVSKEMSENEETINLYFGSKKMIAKWYIHPFNITTYQRRRCDYLGSSIKILFFI